MNSKLFFLVGFLSASLSAMDTKPLSSKEIFHFMGLISHKNTHEIHKLVDSNPAYLLVVDPMINMTALMRAAQWGHVELIEYFFNKNIDINQQDKNGFTALHHAVASEKSESIKCLLRLGASKDIANTDGLTPSIMALTRSLLEIRALLL